MDLQDSNSEAADSGKVRSNFRKFFVRGLGVLLPSVLTIWILIAAYQFLQYRIAAPINEGVRMLIIDGTNWPHVSQQEVQSHLQRIIKNNDKWNAYLDSGKSDSWLRKDTRRVKLNSWWDSYHYGLDLIGLVIAVFLIYSVGLTLGSFIGKRIYSRGEEFINRLPLVRRVYPSVKQVTDFFVGEKKQSYQFNKVVAVEYPRRGMWSVGMITGGTVRSIEDDAKEECVTVFIPSAPTPFTGYVIVLPRTQTLDLPISVEDVVKFIVSGGVLIPPSQSGEGAANDISQQVKKD